MRRAWRSEIRGVGRHWTVDSFVPEKRPDYWLVPRAEIGGMPSPVREVDHLMRTRWPSGISFTQLRRTRSSMVVATESNHASAVELIESGLAEPVGSVPGGFTPKIRLTTVGETWKETARARIREAEAAALTAESIHSLGSLVLLSGPIQTKLAEWVSDPSHTSTQDPSIVGLRDLAGDDPESLSETLRETLEQWHMVLELADSSSDGADSGGHDHGGGGHDA
jgi:hypothetical protein